MDVRIIGDEYKEKNFTGRTYCEEKILVPLLPSMVLVSIHEKEVNKVFEVAGVVRYLFENQKRAEVSNEEVLAMNFYRFTYR